MSHEQAQYEQTAFSPAEIYAQTDRILESRHFRQAKSLEKFLRYVVSKKLAGDEQELKEFTIGLEVFQRGEDYDPRHDAVVRVQANVLRKRLASYYQEEGAHDTWVIELPKGHYVPQFYPRVTGAALALSAEDGEASLPVLADINLSAKEGSRWRRWRVAGVIAATFVLGLLTALGVQHWWGKRILAERAASAPTPNTAGNADYQPLWGKFLEPGVENILAYGTPQFFVSSGVYLRDVQVNSPQDFPAAWSGKILQRATHEPFRPAEIYTGVGETHGVYLLTKFFTKHSNDLRVTRSRMVGWNELKNANVIFLSSMRFHTLAKELPFPSDFEIAHGIASKVINLHPQVGEPSSYGGRQDGQDYAVITVWPGKLHQRRIMVLSGSTTWATLAAAEYVTDPEYLRQLNQHLDACQTKRGHAQHAPYFQVLLRAEVKDNQPISINYVTHHDLEVPDPATAKPETIAQISSQQK